MFSSADDEGQVSEPLNGAHLRSIFSLFPHRHKRERRPSKLTEDPEVYFWKMFE